jgi:hypothetical protein
MKRRIISSDSLQLGYVYFVSGKPGTHFSPEFKPQLTPREMLQLGVFGGAYFEGVPQEFPRAWFAHAPQNTHMDASRNFFKVSASQSREGWQRKGWIHPDDPRGWFQWYCRYYLGRRHPDDERQIKRWQNMVRHARWLNGACAPRDLLCRPRQRQALLHWAYDSRRI